MKCCDGIVMGEFVFGEDVYQFVVGQCCVDCFVGGGEYCWIFFLVCDGNCFGGVKYEFQ